MPYVSYPWGNKRVINIWSTSCVHKCVGSVAVVCDFFGSTISTYTVLPTMKFSSTVGTGSCFLRQSGRGVAWTTHPFSARVENEVRLPSVPAWHVVGEPVCFHSKITKIWRESSGIYNGLWEQSGITLVYNYHVLVYSANGLIFIHNLRNVRPVKPVDKLSAVLNFMDLFTCSTWSNTTSYEGLQFYILESSTEKCWNNAAGKHMPNANSCFVC